MPETKITAEPGMPQVIITREFDAPPDLVFRAYTEPDLLVQWLGPRALTTTIDEFDVRDGGRWRFVQTDPEGNQYGFHGYFHGTPSPENGVVQTFEYEGAPGHVQLDTLTLEDRGGTTLVRTIASFQSVQDRDAMIEANMEWGVREGNERLEELLAKLQVS
jgi:uncharacterized protein YndB with AHSA1/START domain